ncbi:MAG: Asp23/Gls24 family envelope stress response protein [Candidatus Omnitrophota bacterium]
MRRDEQHTDLGTIRIHKNVIASIASIAAMEVVGVKKVGGNFQGKIMELLGAKSRFGINVQINKLGEVKIQLPLVIKYDYSVPEVADKVQENVRNSLERMTSLALKDITINVQSIEK